MGGECDPGRDDFLIMCEFREMYWGGIIRLRRIQQEGSTEVLLEFW